MLLTLPWRNSAIYCRDARHGIQLCFIKKNKISPKQHNPPYTNVGFRTRMSSSVPTRGGRTVMDGALVPQMVNRSHGSCIILDERSDWV